MCKCDKDESEFLFRNKSKGTRHSACRDCYKIIRKKSYESNKDYYIKKSKRRSDEINSWFFDIKSNLKCEVCGFSHVACLDFHHVNSDDKEIEVATLVASGNKKRILKEIEKCIVLCSNCHRIHHFNERKSN
jgi:hypothetical protein